MAGLFSSTLDRYSHVTIDMQREAADRLEAILKAAAPPPRSLA